MSTEKDLNLLRAKLHELQTGQRTDPDFLARFVRLSEGEQLIRLLPAADGGNGFFSETALHRLNGRNLHCPRAVSNKPCPICAYVRKLWDSKLDENIAIARKIKARKRYYFNCIIREEKQQDGSIVKDAGPKILSVGVKLFEKFLSVFFDEDYGDPTNLEAGYDFKIIMEIKDEYPNYDKTMPRPRATPAGTPEQIKTWMENLHDLTALIQVKEASELQEELNVFLGVSTENATLDVPTPSVQTSQVQTPQVATPRIESDTISVEDTNREFQEQLQAIKEGRTS